MRDKCFDIDGMPAHAEAFNAAVAECLEQLQRQLPFGRWTLTRRAGDDWVMVHAAGAQAGYTAPDWGRHDDSICSRMPRDLCAGRGAGREHCVSLPLRESFDVGAYLGVVLYQRDGEALGALGSVDMGRSQPPRGRRQLQALALAGRRIVELMQHELDMLRAARDAGNAMLRQARGKERRWLSLQEWARALAAEEKLRLPLALPAAILATSLRHGLPRSERPLDAVEEAFAGLLGPAYVGTVDPRMNALVLLPEHDGASAQQIETRLRRRLDHHGLALRCCAVSARFDEPLRGAAARAVQRLAERL